ncbi:hypothetical protein C449_02642 [Halococcus saccharolyticus DSM 5350]|uniref:Glycosyltransferase RgtA/B/C/D-like domain-containing protein n=1 Tax=Halococcus saccharolyticus DSM 5350 TaxID=1227455 RepID=M0MNY9_9EURY|nr:hypothetical protein C449_02642 [Halococcus saccharolyticus DSM 5350]
MAAAAVLGLYTGVKGAYIAIAVAIALWFYGRTLLKPSSDSRSSISRYRELINQYGPRLVGFAVVYAVGISVVTGDRGLGLLVCLPVGFGLVTLQAISGVGAHTLVAEAAALYGASTISKYLTNDVYYGGGDTLYHVRNVETLVQTGSVAGISRYEFFPGFAILNGAIRVIGEISAYDTILLTGIFTYGVVVLSAFVLVRAATGNERLGAFVAVGLVMSEPFLYYATYFFPQSLAVALVIFGLYVAYRANQDRETRFRFSLIGLILGAALVVTHQLTIVLFIPIVGILAAATSLLNRIDSMTTGGQARLRLPRGYLAAIVAFLSISYWAYRSTFLAELASSVRTILGFGLFTADSGAPTPTYALGTTLPSLSIETALRSLYSTDGVYQIALLIVFLLGVATVIDRTRTYWPVLPLFSVGIVGSVMMFRTPLTVPGLNRLQLPLTVFFAVVIGVGLYRLSRSGDRNHTTLLAIVVLVAAVGTTAPLNYGAGDDLYAINSGPNLYELYPTPEPQKAYSNAEYRDLESTAGFLRRHDVTLYSFAVDSQAMDGFGVESESAGVNESGIVTGEGVLLYRQQFVDHRLSYVVSSGDGIAIGSVLIDPHWFDQTLATQHKVYASDQTGLLWNPNGSVIAPAQQSTEREENNDRIRSRRLGSEKPTPWRARP